MPIPNDIRQQAERRLSEYCEARIPEFARDQIRMSYKIRGNHVTLIENRVGFPDPEKWTHFAVAQFRFDPKDSTWALFCADRNSRWHEYDLIGPAKDLDDLVQEVDQDPTGIFWG